MSLFSKPMLPNTSAIIGVVILFSVEWLQREKNHTLEIDPIKMPAILRWSIYVSLILTILFFSAPDQQFIYFQF